LGCYANPSTPLTPTYTGRVNQKALGHERQTTLAI
jgi:hypothetical protein